MQPHKAVVIPFILSLLYAILLLSCAPPPPIATPTPSPSPVVDGSRYIRNNPALTRVIVFVHGFTGNSTAAWTNSETGAYWPALLADDPVFDNSNIFVYEYESARLHERRSIDEVADDMRLILDAYGVTRHQEIVLLVHSLGGIITRAYLNKFPTVAQKVKFIYFFSTPTTGSQVARIATTFIGNRLLQDLTELTSGSYLAILQSQWLAAEHGIESYCAYELQPTNGVIVVNIGEATQLCTKRLDPLNKNHIEIVKPADTIDRSYLVFRVAYEEQPIPTPTPTPAPFSMPTDTFNIAVAEFAPLNRNGEPTVNPEGFALASSAVKMIAARADVLEKISEATGEVVAIAGPEQGIGPILPNSEAVRAEQLNADVLVYGDLRRLSETRWQADPRFYVRQTAVSRANEILGPFALGAPLVYLPDNQASKAEFNISLQARLEMLTEIITALGYYDYGNLASYEKAADVLIRAIESSSNSSSNVTGQEVLYLFLGNTYIRQADMKPITEFEAKTALLIQAKQAFDTGLARNMHYGRLYVGLGSVHFETARLAAPPDQPCAWDWNELNAAESAFSTAAAEQDSYESLAKVIRLKANLGMGRVNFIRAQCQIEDKALFRTTSERYHNVVLAMYAEESSLYNAEAAVLAHQDLGNLALFGGLNSENSNERRRQITDGIEHFEAMIDLSLSIGDELHRNAATAMMPYLLYSLCLNGDSEEAERQLSEFTETNRFSDPAQVRAEIVEVLRRANLLEGCINEETE